MQLLENVQNDHNNRGIPPSVFSDIKDPVLKSKNRGAILANIFERYINPDLGYLLAKDFKMCLNDLNGYLNRIPKGERKVASNEMMSHLNGRGYKLSNAS